MSQKRFISLASDTTIKYLYKNDIGKEWLNGIIKDLINIDLTGYQEIGNEFTGGNPDMKSMRLDFLLEKGSDVVIIEVQNSKQNSDKNYFYLYRAAGYNLEANKTYTGTTTLICFNNFIPDNEKIKKEHPLVVSLEFGNSKYDYIKKMIKAYEIILPNLELIEYNTLSDTEKKLYLFLCETYHDMRNYVVDKNTSKVVDILEGLSMNKEFLYAYDHEAWHKKALDEAKKDGIKEGFDKGKTEGIEQGITEGEKNKQLEIAKNMLKKGFNTDMIIELTQLTKDEIKKL